MPGTILVFLETEKDEIKKLSLETLCLAANLAGSNGLTVAAVLAGTTVETLADTAAAYGAEIVYLPHGDDLSLHDTDTHVNALETAIQESGASLLLLGDTPLGKELAPRLAARLKAGLISGCVDVKLEDNNLIGRRPVMNGKAHATICCRPSAVRIATISAGTFETGEPSANKSAEIRRFTLSQAEKPAVEFLEYIKGDPATISLNEAETILAVGKGLENGEKLDIIRELAGLLGASLGGTRVAVDLRWLPLERQIGITGLTVSPRLFISCGISGQYPHVVGMDASDTIIVINKDREAPMFKLASLGIIGSLEDIVPALSERLRREYQAHGEGTP